MSEEVNQTIVKFASNPSKNILSLDSDLSTDAIVKMFADHYPWLTRAVASEVIEDGIKTVTFSEAKGQKN